MSEQDWYECLAFGKLGEDLARKKVHHFLQSVLKQYEYGLTKEDTLKQRQGIDFSFKLENLTFDVKTRKFEYYLYRGMNNDIALELLSVEETNKAGWFFTSTSDVIFYIWLNEQKTGIFDGVILILDKTREFVKEYRKTHIVRTFRSVTNNSVKKWHYHSSGLLIPVCDFPSNALIYCNVDKLSGICFIN